MANALKVHQFNTFFMFQTCRIHTICIANQNDFDQLLRLFFFLNFTIHVAYYLLTVQFNEKGMSSTILKLNQIW